MLKFSVVQQVQLKLACSFFIILGSLVFISITKVSRFAPKAAY